MEKHILFLEDIKQHKLECLPRAIRGEAPKERLNKILDELDILKEVIEHLRLYAVVQAEPEICDCKGTRFVSETLNGFICTVCKNKIE